MALSEGDLASLAIMTAWLSSDTRSQRHFVEWYKHNHPDKRKAAAITQNIMAGRILHLNNMLELTIKETREDGSKGKPS